MSLQAYITCARAHTHNGRQLDTNDQTYLTYKNSYPYFIIQDINQSTTYLP